MMQVERNLISDHELGQEALAADPDVVVPHDAVSLWTLAPATPPPGSLPDWYMPPSAGGRRRHSASRRCVVYLLVATLTLINAAGLCSTYGSVGLG